MANGMNKLKAALNKAIDYVKNIPTLLAKLATPVGQVLGWLILIILIVILFTVIGQAATRAIARLVGINWNYKTYNNDLEVIKQLNASGYESTIDAENFQNYKAFEYAVLMDAAEYLRNTKQEMFDIGFNEGEYQFERSILANRKPSEYNAKIAELSKQYANIGGGSENTSAKLLSVNFDTNQRKLLDSTLQSLINTSGSERNVDVSSLIEEKGSIRGGTNRVTGPFLMYEFKNGASGDSETYESTPFNFTVDSSKLSGTAQTVWNKYSKAITYAAGKYGIDPYLIIAVICRESSGKLNCITWNSSHTQYAYGLMQIFSARSKTLSVVDVQDNSFTIDSTEEGMKDSAKRQVEVGTALLRAHIKNFEWNAHDGVGGYNLGDAGYQNNPSNFNNYWNKLKDFFGGGDETWAIKKEEDKYYKVYTNINTFEITKTEEIKPSITASTTGSNTTTIANSSSGTATQDSAQEKLKAKYNRIIFIGDDRTAQMYYTKNGWNGAGEEVDQLDALNNYWEAKTNAGITWLEKTAIPRIEEYIDDKTAIVCLLGVNDVLTAPASQYATLLNRKAEEWKNKKKDVATYFVSVNPIQETSEKELKNSEIRKWNEEIKGALSRNITYIDTYSQISDTAQFQNWIQYKEKTYNEIYNRIINEINGYPEATRDESTYSLEGNGTGSLEPYIYVTRENIEFSYYFDANNQVIEYPLILNAFNSKLNVGSENSAEVNRALLGISPVVFPDEDVSKYTATPYYSNKTENVVYKIPLRTILGRYMPKAELLNAWSYIKQSVERDTENTTEKGIMDYTIDAIKGIYNEACLLGEDKKTVKEKIESGDMTRVQEEYFYYSDEQTHQKSFVTFEKAGIESTKYDINGLQPLDGNDGSANIKLVTDFISAVTIEDDFSVSYEVATTNNETISTEDPITGELTETINPVITKVEDKIKISLKELKLSDKITPGNFIVASGSPEEGYTPPTSLDGVDGYYVRGSKDVEGILKEVKDATLAYITAEKAKDGGEVTITSFPDEVVAYNPIFITDKSVEVTQKLKVEHTRMPILLVKSASTWCREVEYTHNIIQNQFRQNNKKYIIPKSVTSIGIKSFDTTATSGYRGRAYSEVFSKIQEKDVINMLMFLEMSAQEGSNDSYEYMRDLYKLVKASQEYAKENGHTSQNDSRFIHEDTYKYVYIPDSVYYFNDAQSQKIYWLELLTATKDDPITKVELNTIRTKDRDLTWQLVEYDKYEECNSSGSTKVYALSPFGSPLLRTYFETMYRKGQDVNGSFKVGRHSGADWSGRAKISDILEKGDSITSTDGIGGAIYQYEYTHLSDQYDEDTAKAKLEEILNDQKVNMPIVAIAPGRVEEVKYSAREGFYVKILHSDEEDMVSYYMHMKRWPLVNKGDYVGAGTLLGYEGNTGRSFGAHLHFQLAKAGSVVSPKDYIFPSFNPFYYEDKAKDANYDLTNEYMSLERTVLMVGNNSNSVSKVKNQVPSKALVQDYDTLIQNQGSMEGRTVTLGGNLDWSTAQNFDSVEDYVQYLEENEFYDLFLREAFFDKQLAIAEGYLQNSFLLAGDICVKVDLPGALPQLTMSDLKTMLDGWLHARYKNQTKIDKLMRTVFTDECLKKMLEGEQKYKVSAVFAIAVATIEQNLGLSGTSLASPPACNIFSIKGVDHKYGSGSGYILYQQGKQWRRYGSYANAWDDFADLIGGRGRYYFNKGNYTIGTIGPIYCDAKWSESVTKMVINIMQYYPGEWSPPSAGFSANATEILAIAKNCMKFYVDNGYKYCQGSAGRIIPPYDSNGNVRQKKHSHCSTSGCASGTAYRADCSTYVSWVIYEYAKAHGYKELQDEFDSQHSSYQFQDIGQKLKSGKNSGFYKYLELVQYGIPGNNFGNIKNKIQPGDILVYRQGSGHHVEVAAEGTSVYTYGTTQTSVNTNTKYTRRSDATCVIRLKQI